MSYKLVTILDELDGAGMISVDDDMTIETLNEAFGINIHHDLVITAHEANKIRNALVSLQVLALSNGDEFLEKLALNAMETIE
jgi:hypothetical protein